MGDGLAPRGAARPRRESSAAAVYGGQNPQRHDEDVYFVQTYRENQGAPERLAGESSRIADRRHSAPQVVHQRHMPVGTQKFHIPRKTKEKLALFQLLSCESREYEDMMTALTSGYLDPASAGCFTYSNPRLVHSETLEKEFVEKRKELKADGRTEKELEESYCFLLSDSSKLQTLCEKGLFVGQSWITVLGNPTKGVYLSRCSDLLQLNPFTPGASGEIIIFKVIKGKVKSIYENMKNLLDPTPRFDSHLSKNISKVTSLMSYRAYELTQHYFYEYSFDELRQRPRQVCPYAVVSFHFKGKDTLLTSKPMAPLRLNSQAAEKSQECAQYTVWSGDLVKDDKVLFQISLRSSSPPFLPHKLPEKLDMKWLMRWDQATRQLPRSLFSYNLYNSSSSQEVVKDGHCCSLLEAVDRNRSTTSVSKLLQELESRAVVLVTPLTERGFLFLLSSVQMALPHERGENWRRSLQALFVFPESRHTKSTPQSSVSSEACSDSVSADSVMPGLNHFVPALHFALGKARTNPPPELSAGVEQQAREYLTGIKDGALRPYPMGQYEPELEQGGRQYPVPKHHRLGLDTCLRPYLCGPALYLLLLSQVKHLVQPLIAKQKRHEPETTGRTQGDQKMQQLIDLVLTCKRNAEKEVQSEMKSGARKRRLEQEQETAQRALKHLKASQELRHLNAPQQQDTSHRDTTEVPSSPGSLTSLIGSVGLKDTDLREEEGSELATKLIALLTNLNQKATDQSLSDPREAAQKESSPFDRIALKLGLPTNCDIDLRKQDDLEEQMGGSVSSQEGFSPSSHSGELNHLRSAHRDRNRDRKRPQRDAPVVCEEEIQLQLQQPEIPWILIPITGLCSERYTHRDTDLPQDPRFQHLVSMTTTPASAPASASFSISTATTVSSLPMIIVPTAPVPLDSPTLYLPSSSPDPSPPASPSQCPSPDPSSPPSHCPSPEPDPGSSPEPEPAASPEHGEASNGPLTVGGEAFNDLLTDGGEAFNDPQTEENEEIPVSGDRTEPPESPEIAVQSPAPCSSSAQLSPKASSPPEPTLSDEELPDILSLDPMSPPLLIQDIDSIVDRHLDSFSSDIQCILRNQCIYNYTFPQSPHSTSHPERPTSTFPHGQMSSFSQYVSFYNPSPPVHRYVNSLHKRISGVLSDYENNWTPNRPDSAATATATTTTDLASRVSEFVASIRAANDDRDAPPETGMWQTDSQRELSCVSTSSMDCDESEEAYIDNTRQEIQNDVVCSEDLESDTDISSGRRQVQFSSNHLEISFRNELETHSGSSRDVEDLRERADSSVSPTINSDTSALNTLINQLQPEVFTNLVEIIKDIKRNSQHFYIHFTEQDDYMAQEIRAQLLTQSYIEQSPVSFLSHEENANGKLLVVIKNQDIAAHIHQIPELLSLKRRSSVVFVGVDTAEDMRNHSYQELFVSGGQVISDEMVLNPDFVSHDKLSTLLSVLEKHSSSENLWRWKVHCKTHKKLKEQARFRRDAASLLDVLLAYHKRQIVDFLPYHKCDMSQGCELLDCVMELQGRYSSYRHTVLLTENRLVNSSGVGVIVCGIEEFLQDFNRLVGLNDNNNKQPIRDEPQSTQDHSQSSLIPSVSEQLLPESSLSSIPLHSEQDFEVLHRAISQLRAERQKQLRESQAKDTSGAQGAVSTTIATTEQRPFTPPSDKCSNTEQLTPGRKAVAATLELIHSSLHPSEEDQTTTQPRVQVENQLTIDHKRCPETQLTIDRKRSPETQLTIDCKRNPETQAPVVEPRGSEVPSGSQGSSVPSMPKIPVQYEPANATVRPPSPAPNTSLHQSNTTETTNTSPAESSRTKRRKKQKKNAEEDMASFNPAKKPKLENSKGKQKYLLLANDNMNLINPRLLADPNLWGTVALIREGLLPTGFPIAPINAAKVAEWTTKSRVRRVVDPVPKRCPKGWWPTRITIYDSHERPWAVVAKIDKQTKEITPVFLLLGQYSHSQPPPLYRQYHEDRYDMVMYF